MSWFLQIIPTVWPEVLGLPTKPAIFHGADFSLVTPEKPARVGELLIMSVSGLGPVKGNLDLGKPFPAGDLLEVNSPVDVTVNGKPASVVVKVGWPTMTNVYRVDFVVPEGTAPGMASVVPTVAWINGSEANPTSAHFLVQIGCLGASARRRACVFNPGTQNGRK